VLLKVARIFAMPEPIFFAPLALTIFLPAISSASNSAAVGAAAVGAIIGAIAGGGKGAAIGAGAGAGGGALTQVLTKGGAIKVPAETVLTFQLDKPVKIVKAQ